MSESESIIMTREVDWSTLHYGFNIPVEMQPVLYEAIGQTLGHGEKMDIRVNILSQTYEASLQNSGFSRRKFDGHTDIVRVMYKGEKKLLTNALQELFSELYNHMLIKKSQLPSKHHVKIEKEHRQQFVFSVIKADGDLQFKIEAVDHLNNIGDLITEEVFESDTPQLILKDPNARIEEVRKIEKVRKIDRSIIDHLKKLYDYRCQITGEKVGERYGSHLVEAHHIDYFVNSQNNDSSNIIIISPNFHRVIHQNNPIFNWNKLQFEFDNGVIEKVQTNHHLSSKRH